MVSRSPKQFQREEASASFGSGWMYCASRRCWESYWKLSQMGYNQVSPKICSKPARSSQQILHDRHMEFICFLDAQEAKWSNQD
jgi:hypothetical protein